MEDTKYYIREGQKNAGPFLHDEIAARIKNGGLKGDDYIFAVGTPGWVQIKTLMQFSAFIKSDNPEVWYVHKNKQNLGPFSAEKIISMIESAEIDINDYVYKKGIPGWTLIKEIPELSELIKKPGNLEKIEPLPEQEQQHDQPVQPEQGVPQDTLFLQRESAVKDQKEDAVEYYIKKEGEEEVENSLPHDSGSAPGVQETSSRKKNVPELVFGVLLIGAGLLNLSSSFTASVLVAFAGTALVAYYLIKNRKGVNNAK